MSDRPDAWGPRRRGWRIERLTPSLERLPERHERFATLGDLPVDGLYGPWDWEAAGATARHRARRPDGRRPPRRAAARRRRPLRRRRPGPRHRPARRAAVHPRHPPDRVPRPPVDDAHVRRVRLGRGHERPLPAAARRRPDRASRSRTTCRRSTATTRTIPRPRASSGPAASPCRSLADMELLLDGLPLDRVSTSMTINSPAAPIWAMYIVAAEKAGVPRAALEGTTQNDILKEYVAQKEFLFPPEPSMRLVVDTIEFGTREMPRWNTVSISGYHIREAGSTAVQELAFTIADGMAYVEAAMARGLRVDDFAPRLSFFFNSHSDFFEEIAKFRASRRIWWKLMSERYRAENERSTWMRFHTQTAGVSLTPQQPLNNLTRVATQALAAILGGTQSLHTDAYDEALAVPTAEAALLALRQQQILARGDRRRLDRRPAGRLVVRGGADQRGRARGLALPRRDRPAGRHGRRDRRGLPAARDRGRRLPVPARVRRGRAGDRRRQPLRQRRADHGAGARGAGGLARAAHGPPRADPRRARRRGDRRGARGPARGGVAARAPARPTSCPTSSAAPSATRPSASSAASCARSSGSTGSRSRSRHRPAQGGAR